MVWFNSEQCTLCIENTSKKASTYLSDAKGDNWGTAIRAALAIPIFASTLPGRGVLGFLADLGKW